MPRIDIAETIKLIDFPEKVWEWLDLFGDIVAANKFGYPDAFFRLYELNFRSMRVINFKNLHIPMRNHSFTIPIDNGR